MMSQIPTKAENIKKSERDKELLRTGIIAELDAINLYEQLAASTENQELREVVLSIAREEKTHMGEFQELLLNLDEEQKKELEAGKEEVREMRSKK